MAMPGYGDSATWGPVTDPRDPRYDEGPEDEERQALETAVEELEARLPDIADPMEADDLRYGIKEVEKLIERGHWKDAWKKIEALTEQVPA